MPPKKKARQKPAAKSSKREKKGTAAIKRREQAREKLKADVASGRVKIKCQAMVYDAEDKIWRHCKRNATAPHLLYYDEVKIPLYGKLPIDCCALCGLHWGVLGGKGLAYGVKLWYEGKMDWDEYCAMNPDIIDESCKKFEMKK